MSTSYATHTFVCSASLRTWIMVFNCLNLPVKSTANPWHSMRICSHDLGGLQLLMKTIFLVSLAAFIYFYLIIIIFWMLAFDCFAIDLIASLPFNVPSFPMYVSVLSKHDEFSWNAECYFYFWFNLFLVCHWLILLFRRSIWRSFASLKWILGMVFYFIQYYFL